MQIDQTDSMQEYANALDLPEEVDLYVVPKDVDLSVLPSNGRSGVLEESATVDPL